MLLQSKPHTILHSEPHTRYYISAGSDDQHGEVYEERDQHAGPGDGQDQGAHHTDQNRKTLVSISCRICKLFVV